MAITRIRQDGPAAQTLRGQMRDEIASYLEVSAAGQSGPVGGIMRVAADAYEMDSIRRGIERLDLVNPEPEIRIAVRELSARRAKLTPLRVFSVIAL